MEGCNFVEKRFMKTKTDNRESYKEFRSNEPSGEGKNIGKNGSRSGNGRTGKVNEAWDKPVSKRYYGKLKEKVSRIVQALGYVRGYTDELMKCIDRYLATKEMPVRRYCDEEFLAIFFTLRYEIDEAIARSASARLRAAERRVRKEAGKEKASVEETKPKGNTSQADTDAHVVPEITAVRPREAQFRHVSGRDG